MVDNRDTLVKFNNGNNRCGLDDESIAWLLENHVHDAKIIAKAFATIQLDESMKYRIIRRIEKWDASSYIAFKKRISPET